MSKPNYVMATFDIEGNKLTCAAPPEALIKIFRQMNDKGQKPEIISKDIDKQEEHIWYMFLAQSQTLGFKAKAIVKSFLRDFITIAGLAGLVIYILHSVGVIV